VLGRRYAEWCTGAPLLESAVAAAAMAQDELGHARSFYPLLRGFPEATATDTVEEAGWQTRPTSAMAALDEKFRTWSDFVAANFLADTALTSLLESAVDSPYEPLRQRARKIVQEEQAHRVHAEGWVRRLGAESRRVGEPESGSGLRASLEGIWDDAFCWLGQADDAVFGALRGAGLIASGPEALRERLRGRVGPVLEAVGLAELLERPLPWDRWDAKARRVWRNG
jgi:phenylacetate-CoA oxygenase PaaI subunit